MSDLLTIPRLREMLEGNRRLTVRTLQAYPEQALFVHAAPNMRTAAALFQEILGMDRAFVRGTATGQWEYVHVAKDASTKEELLQAFATLQKETQDWWDSITEERLFAVEDDRFGWGPPQPNLERILYSLENEIHHRGQIYVYLRELGVEPPAFYER
ncbi:MAG: DinB family protein [Bacillota bacterium]